MDSLGDHLTLAINPSLAFNCAAFPRAQSQERSPVLPEYIPNTPAVPRLVREGIKTVEGINQQFLHLCRMIHQSQIHRDSPPPLLIAGKPEPIGHATAFLAKVKTQLIAAPGVAVGSAGCLDLLPQKAVSPQRPVAAAGRAVACSGAFERAGEGPFHFSAMAGSVEVFHREMVAPGTLLAILLPEKSKRP